MLTRLKAPLLLGDPSPVANQINTPVDETVLSPATGTSRLPAPDVALPKQRRSRWRLLAKPVYTAIAPLLPFTEVSVLNDRTPLTPELPEFALTRLKALLHLADPNPVANEMDQQILKAVL